MPGVVTRALTPAASMALTMRSQWLGTGMTPPPPRTTGSSRTHGASPSEKMDTLKSSVELDIAVLELFTLTQPTAPLTRVTLHLH